jgi:hypothetical protein
MVAMFFMERKSTIKSNAISLFYVKKKAQLNQIIGDVEVKMY